MESELEQQQIRSQLSKNIVDRNIANSQKIILGDFESALTDVISQLEEPVGPGGVGFSAAEKTRRIASALRQGFSGLPPNGFDFCTWLWDVAPLHAVQLPGANSIGTAQGFRYGVIHLRKIASIVLDLYVAEQPHQAPVVEELLDSSVGWVDARNHVGYALVGHYIERFDDLRGHLLTLAGSPYEYRALVPLGVAAQILAADRKHIDRALELIEACLPRAASPVVFDGLRYVLRIGGMYGDQLSLVAFLQKHQAGGSEEVRRLICEFLRNPRLHWREQTRAQLAHMLRDWKRNSALDEECLDRALLRLEPLRG